MFPKTFSSWLRLLAVMFAAVAALFGVPLIIDPPPRDATEESQDVEGRTRRKRRRRQRAP